MLHLPPFDLLFDRVRINLLELLQLSQDVLLLVGLVLQLFQKLIHVLFEICDICTTCLTEGNLSFLLIHPRDFPLILRVALDDRGQTIL